MEETLTLSQAADMIIVMTFSIFTISFFFYGLMETVSMVIDAVKGWRKKRREKKQQKLDAEKTDTPTE